MALLETSSQKFFETGGCVSCHHQNITDLAATEVRAKGLRVDPTGGHRTHQDARAARRRALLCMNGWTSACPKSSPRRSPTLAAMGYPANRATDALVADIAASQLADGSWPLVGGRSAAVRPPKTALITRAALCVRSLKAYGPPGRAAEMNARIAKARQWLLAATPVTAEERNMRLLGLHWAGADGSTLKPSPPRSPPHSSATAAGARSTASGLTHTPPASRSTRWRKPVPLAPTDPALRERREFPARDAGRERIVARREPLAEVPGLLQQRLPVRRRSVDQRMGDRLGDDGAGAGGAGHRHIADISHSNRGARKDRGETLPLRARRALRFTSCSWFNPG